MPRRRHSSSIFAASKPVVAEVQHQHLGEAHGPILGRLLGGLQQMGDQPPGHSAEERDLVRSCPRTSWSPHLVVPASNSWRPGASGKLMSRSRGIHPGLLGGRSVGVDRAADPVRAVSILQTVLLYGAVPVALYLLIALLAAGRGLSRRPRYRPGDQWPYPSSWWSANHEGSGLPEPSADGSAWCPSRLTDDGQMRSRSAPVEPDVIVHLASEVTEARDHHLVLSRDPGER